MRMTRIFLVIVNTNEEAFLIAPGRKKLAIKDSQPGCDIPDTRILAICQRLEG